MADVKRSSLLKKILIGVATTVVVLVVVGFFAVPPIVSSMVPGIVADAAGQSIQGSVKVGSARVGWSGPTTLKSVTLLDPAGAAVATVDVASSHGIVSILTAGMNLGETEISGKVDLVLETKVDGTVTSNLERATAPRPAVPGSTGGAPAGGTKPASLPKGLVASVKVNAIDVTLVEKDAAGATVSRAAMTGLKGEIAIDASKGPAAATADLRAEFSEAVGKPGSGTLAIKASASGLTDAAGVLQLGSATMNADVSISGAPTQLLDTLAKQRGVLAAALGKTVNATVKAQATGVRAAADITLNAPNAAADIAVVRDGGRLRATRAGTITLQSTAFVQQVPALAKALIDAGVTIDGAGWPGASVTIASLNVPADAGATWAGAQVDVSARIGAVTGQLTRPGQAAEFLNVQPVVIAVRSGDFGQGITLTAATKATIGSQSAGDFDATVTLGGLLDAAGKLTLLDGKLPTSIAADIRAGGVATSLLQPFVAATGQPIVLDEDVGPTIDLRLSARSAGEVKGDSLPPTEVDFSLTSRNIASSGKLALTQTKLSGVGVGAGAGGSALVVRVERAGPLVSRILSPGAGAGVASSAGLAVSGPMGVDVRVTEFSLPLLGGKFDVSLARVLASVRVTGSTVRLPGGQGLTIASSEMTAGLDVNAGVPAGVTLAGPLTIDGENAALDANLTVAGALGPSSLPLLGARRVQGAIALTGLSGGAIQKLAFGGEAAAGDVAVAMRDLLAEFVGQRIDVRATFDKGASSGSQPVALSVRGPQLVISSSAVLSDGEVAVGETTLTARVSPRAAQAALRVAGQSAGAVASLSMREAADIVLQAAPLRVPIKAGTLEPDWAKATDRIVGVSLSISKPLIADNIVVAGEQRSFGIAGLRATFGTPLAMLEPGVLAGTKAGPNASKPMQASVTAEVIGSSAAESIAKLRADFNADPRTGQADARVSLSDVATAKADALLGKPRMLSGAVGERAAISVDARRESASKPFAITGTVSTERLKLNNISVAMSGDAISLGQVLTLAWDVDPAWAREFVLTPGADGRAPLTLEGVTRVLAEVRTLSIASSASDAQGNPTAGPMKPGVFALDATLAIPMARLRSPERTDLIELESIDATVKGGGGGGGGGAPGTLSIAAGIRTVKSGALTTPETTRLTATVSNLADARGVVNTNNAVLSLQAQTGTLPTSLVEALSNQNGQLEPILGKDMSLKVDLANISKTGSAGTARVDLKSPNASFTLGGPVAGGVLTTAGAGGTPLRAELSEFRYSKGKKMGTVDSLNPLGYLGFVAGVERLRDDVNKAPSVVSSPNLAIPIDGDLSKLNGRIDVDLGRINLKMEQNFLQLLDIAALNKVVDRVANAQQRAVPAFAITIDKGVASYKDVQLPIGSYDFRASGTVNLVTQQMDVVTYVPTVSLAPGVLSSINESLGKGFGRILPTNITDALMVPIRTSGPLSDTKTSIDIALMVKEAGDRLLKPENLLNNLGNLLGGGRDKAPAPAPAAPKKDAPAQQPDPQPNPQPGPNAPTKPADKPAEPAPGKPSRFPPGTPK